MIRKSFSWIRVAGRRFGGRRRHLRRDPRSRRLAFEWQEDRLMLSAWFEHAAQPISLHADGNEGGFVDVSEAIVGLDAAPATARTRVLTADSVSYSAYSARTSGEEFRHIKPNPHPPMRIPPVGAPPEIGKPPLIDVAPGLDEPNAVIESPSTPLEEAPPVAETGGGAAGVDSLVQQIAMNGSRGRSQAFELAVSPAPGLSRRAIEPDNEPRLPVRSPFDPLVPPSRSAVSFGADEPRSAEVSPSALFEDPADEVVFRGHARPAEGAPAARPARRLGAEPSSDAWSRVSGREASEATFGHSSIDLASTLAQPADAAAACREAVFAAMVQPEGDAMFSAVYLGKNGRTDDLILALAVALAGRHVIRRRWHARDGNPTLLVPPRRKIVK